MEKLENNRVLIVDTFPISNYDSQLSAYSFLVQSSHHHNIYISNNFSDQINLYFLYRHVSWIAPIIRRNKLILIYIYVAANVQIQLMYTLADRPANVYFS